MVKRYLKKKIILFFKQYFILSFNLLMHKIINPINFKTFFFGLNTLNYVLAIIRYFAFKYLGLFCRWQFLRQL